jgi:elongation of very long chain fatty acids protein 4
MASPGPTLLIAMAYLTSIYYGRRFMAKRKPFSIRGILIPYNLAMALLNLYIGLEVIKLVRL